MSRGGGLTQARPTENASLVTGLTAAAYAETVAEVLGGGSQAVRVVATLFAVLPRAVTWLVVQYRNYWPAFHRAPRPGRHNAGAR